MLRLVCIINKRRKIISLPDLNSQNKAYNARLLSIFLYLRFCSHKALLLAIAFREIYISLHLRATFLQYKNVCWGTNTYIVSTH